MPKALQELISTMRFPVGGIDLMHLPSGQRPGTTAVGNNVRGFEPMTGRARGGSRPGIERYINEQVNGSDYIQHLNYLVTASGLAVGASFNGIELGDIGGLGVDNFGGLTPTDFSGWGGGGYQPALPRKPNRLTLSIIAVSAGSFTSTSAKVPIGAVVTIAATLRDFLGSGQAFENILLNTSPSGRVGDNTTQTTVFDLNDPPLGSATFMVTDTRIEKVVYSAKDTSNPLKAVNTVSVTYNPADVGYVIIITYTDANTPQYQAQVQMKMNDTVFATAMLKNGPGIMYRTSNDIPLLPEFLLNGVDLPSFFQVTEFHKIDSGIFKPGANVLNVDCPTQPGTLGGGGLVVLKLQRVGATWSILDILVSDSGGGAVIGNFPPGGYNFPFTN